MKDLIFSEDFARYRRKQIEAVAEYVKSNLFDADPRTMFGAIEMARRLVRLPEKICQSKEDKEKLNKLIHEDLNGLYATLTRYTLQ